MGLSCFRSRLAFDHIIPGEKPLAIGVKIEIGLIRRLVSNLLVSKAKIATK
jgi:hypothetical protein